jgi:hypothetical protein
LALNEYLLKFMLKEEEENNIDLSNHKESKETNFSSFDD